VNRSVHPSRCLSSSTKAMQEQLAALDRGSATELQ
jgi:hypothetical protein